MGGAGCFSFVGRVGERGQKIYLGSPECFLIGQILHETLHGQGLMSVNSPQNDWISLDQTGTSRFHFWWKHIVRPQYQKTLRKKSSWHPQFDPQSILVFGPKDFGIEDRRRGRERRQSNRWIQKLRSGENNQRCFRGEFQICAIKVQAKKFGCPKSNCWGISEDRG